MTNPLNIEIMEIKKEDWTAFAEFIARQSEHMCSEYWEDGTYIKCPYSTMERAYTAFQVFQQTGSYSEVKKFWDVNIDAYNPEAHCDPQDIEIERKAQEYLAMQDEIEYAFKEAAGFTCFGVEDWEPEWDNYCVDREKQITRIAHELADKHENLHVFGSKSWMSLVYPFYEKYELNSDERCLFTQEYYSQHYFRYGYV